MFAEIHFSNVPSRVFNLIRKSRKTRFSDKCDAILQEDRLCVDRVDSDYEWSGTGISVTFGD